MRRLAAILAVTVSAAAVYAAEPVMRSLPDLHIEKRVIPRYPDEAKRAGIEGEVRVRLVISLRGDVTDAEVLVGDELLVPPTLKAVRKWRFQPLVIAGQKVVAATQIIFNYRLHSNDLMCTPERLRHIERTGEQPIPAVAGREALHSIRHATPAAYPESLRKKGIGGAVAVRARISRAGKVDRACVISGHPQLARAAVNAVREWEFAPFDKPVATELKVTFGETTSARIR